MGIMHKYREGDRFFARLVEIHNEGEDPGDSRYILELGGVRTGYSKRELDAIECMPVYETTGAAEISGMMQAKYMQGYNAGLADAKKIVMDALGIRDEQAGYERAKQQVMKLFETEEAENAGADKEG